MWNFSSSFKLYITRVSAENEWDMMMMMMISSWTREEKFYIISSYLSNRKRFPCLHSLIWTREGLGEFETVMQTRDEVEDLHNCREFSQPLECLYQAMQTQEKSFLSLLENIFKINSTSEGNFVYWLLEPKRFSQYTLKNQSSNRQRASERRVNESDISFATF